jgi:hypothetical protein
MWHGRSCRHCMGHNWSRGHRVACGTTRVVGATRDTTEVKELGDKGDADVHAI